MKIDLISLENYKSMAIQKIQNLDVYQTNITNLLNLEKKKRYDNEKKIAIIEGQK